MSRRHPSIHVVVEGVTLAAEETRRLAPRALDRRLLGQALLVKQHLDHQFSRYLSLISQLHGVHVLPFLQIFQQVDSCRPHHHRMPVVPEFDLDMREVNVEIEGKALLVIDKPVLLVPPGAREVLLSSVPNEKVSVQRFVTLLVLIL